MRAMSSWVRTGPGARGVEQWTELIFSKSLLLFFSFTEITVAFHNLSLYSQNLKILLENL